MPSLTIIYWRSIPAQVVARADRAHAAKYELSARFQEAIDSAAMRVGMIGTDEYLSQWRQESRPCSDDLETEAIAEAKRLEAEFTAEALDALARRGGLPEGAQIE